MRIRSTIHILRALLALCACVPGAALAHEAWGIVVDERGQLYFSDVPSNTIWRLTVDRQLEVAARDKHSHALVIDSAGNIYGTHHPGEEPVRSVWRLSPDGRLTDVAPPTPDFPLHLQSFTMDADGNMFSENPFRSDHDEFLLLRRTPDGAVSRVAGSRRGFADGRGAEAQFTRIDGMTLGPDGALYVTDGPFVRRITADGSVTTLHKEPLTTTRWDEDLMGLAVHENGSVYVADYSGRRVIELLPNGSTGRVHGVPGLLWSVTGVTFHKGDIYILDHLRLPLVILGNLQIGPYIRIRKISADNREEHLATVWGRNTTVAAVAAVGLVGAAAFLWFRRFNPRKGGKNASGKTGTADFMSGMISALPPLHELARNAGLDLPAYLGELQRQAAAQPDGQNGPAPRQTTVTSGKDAKSSA
ncbi:hypothetical protein BH20VER1_BH20VER1_17250 [soil metagenome]